jgi:OmpA-OmpF porin, OOP family
MKRIFIALCIILASVLMNSRATAQIDVEQKTKDAAVNRADQRTNEGIDKGLDAVEDGVKSLFKKKDKSPKKTETTQSETEAKEQTETREATDKPEVKQQPGLTSYSKFDFIPGQKVIFFDDFSQDNTGDFPALWYSNGSGEVVTLNNYPGKWLNLTATGCYYPERDLLTSENFTVEFDLIPDVDVASSFYLGFYIVSGNIKNPDEGGAIPGVAGVKTNISSTAIDFSGYSDGAYSGDGTGSISLTKGEKVHLSYWIQKQRMRIYLNEKKVVDAPRIVPAGYKFNVLRFENNSEYKPLVGNFRVAAGLPDTRNKLITEGKLVTYGIYFDVNSDKVKPESYGTLKEIAGILNEVPDVKVKIYGHTDSDGDDAKNLDLSKRRAASVKAELVKSFGVKAERMETDGLGETKPIAPNDTPANKAQNRRVEFIKL